MSKKEEQAVIKAEEPMMSGAMSVEGIVAQQKLIRDVMAKVMQKDHHYGVIPGCNKPSLWKSGAEVLCLTFRLSPQFSHVETWDGKHLTVKSICTLTHIPSGKNFGSGSAIASTKEKKHRLRKDGPKVVENNNLEDVWNTVIKMADKRALIASVLVVTGASDIFTQDMGEDAEPVVIIEGEANVKDEPKADAKPEPWDWNGKIVKVVPEQLPGGRRCWTLVGFDGLEFKTIEEEVANAPNGNPVRIKYKKNGKGTLVIEKLEEVHG